MQVRWCQSGDALGVRSTRCSSSYIGTIVDSFKGYRRIFEGDGFGRKNLAETYLETDFCFCDREGQSRLPTFEFGDHL